MNLYELALQAAAAECDALKARLATIEAWQENGERLIASTRRGVLFDLGEWWADRPWRKRPAVSADECPDGGHHAWFTRVGGTRRYCKKCGEPGAAVTVPVAPEAK